MHSKNQEDGGEKIKRVIGPVLAPDAACPSSGIGPVMPEHLVRAQLAAADPVEVTDAAVLDPTAIGPLLPGNEIYEELRHLQNV